MSEEYINQTNTLNQTNISGTPARAIEAGLKVHDFCPRKMKKPSDTEFSKNLDFFRKYHVAEDPEFNEKKNREIIDGTIKKNDALRRTRTRAFKQRLGQRIDIVASYLKSRAVDSGKPIEKYLGKRWMARLRGEQIIKKLQDTLMVRSKEGKIIRKPGEVISK